MQKTAKNPPIICDMDLRGNYEKVYMQNTVRFVDVWFMCLWNNDEWRQCSAVIFSFAAVCAIIYVV